MSQTTMFGGGKTGHYEDRPGDGARETSCSAACAPEAAVRSHGQIRAVWREQDGRRLVLTGDRLTVWVPGCAPRRWHVAYELEMVR